MKITAIIADDHVPEGRTETYTLDRYIAAPEEAETVARSQIERIVTFYNASLRPGDLPRRLLSLSLGELTAAEAAKLGYDSWHKGKTEADNYFPKGHPRRGDWQDGWMDAECQNADDAEEY